VKLPFLTRVPWRALILAWLAFMTGSWASDGLKGEPLFAVWWHPLGQYPGYVTALVCVVFMGTSIFLYHNRQAFSLARSLSRHLCEPHAVVILLVSPARPTLVQTSTLFPLHITDDRGNSVELTGTSLTDDIQALDAIMWNWQQLLRAIVPHVTDATLQRLHLIGSPGVRGSFEQLPLCQQVLAHYLPQVQIVPERASVDFEDFNALERCMRRIIQDEKRRGMSERDIIIDVTGGIKTASIAGASITFNSQVMFQYVQTQPPYEVYAYDVLYQASTSLESS
jgi:hypothetical protein